MAMRDLVMGGGGCSVPTPGASSSNPLGGLADSIFSSASKTQERVRELPGLAGPGGAPGGAQGLLGRPFQPGPLPGFEAPGAAGQLPDGMAAQFMGRFDGLDREFEGAWGEAARPGMPPPPPWAAAAAERGGAAHFDEFERIFGQLNMGGAPAPPQPYLDGGAPPQQLLSGFLRSFVGSARSAAPFLAPPVPDLGLSHSDKERIRNRSSIMARHLFAERGEAFVDSQVSALLQALHIDGRGAVEGPMGGRFAEFEDYWNEGRRGAGPPPPPGAVPDQWAAEFAQKGHAPPGAPAWAEEFAQEREGGWADEFGQEMAQQAAVRAGDGRLGDAGGRAAMEQTRHLVETLSNDANPKMRNSKFLQFVSKMSRGELLVDGDGVKEAAAAPAGGAPEAWAQEFDGLHHHTHTGDTWVDEFHTQQPPRSWADEFARERQGPAAAPPAADTWAEEFQTGGGGTDWAEEFGGQVAGGAFGEEAGDSSWLDSYSKFVEEQARGEAALPAAARWQYVFADSNPYVGHPQPFAEGQTLFRQGLLSEAVLAFEAEVLKNPENAEGWRLLGVAHAENDDDPQAIAAMVRALDADPTNLEVLLALGVSHTNELKQAEALGYLRRWMQHHPAYGALLPPNAAQHLSQHEMAELFGRAADMAPQDADVFTVLGVLCNVSREYERAVAAFERALELRPRDYSLWNKLGATQANSARSADAISAYQKAVELKPNYVRAWSNMGIGYANQGKYAESLPFYARAVAMNPRDDNVWQYLRISLSCAGRADLAEACDVRDVERLQREFPL